MERHPPGAVPSHIDASHQAALEAWSALIALTMGHLTYQLTGHLTAADTSPAAGPPAQEFPRVAAAISSGSFDFDRAFEVALDALITGLRC